MSASVRAVRHPVAAAVSTLLSATLALAVLCAGALLLGLGPAPSPPADSPFGVSAFAIADIPPLYLRLFLAAAQRYGLDWTILAGIARVECDDGRDPAPSCTQEGAVNSAGAGGPAQFLASTWSEYGVTPTGRGVPDRWNPADAIYSMANYLRASGAPGNYRQAIFAYNHAEWYVDLVLQWAARYRVGAAAQGSFTTIAPAPLTESSRATLMPDNGHVALAPADAPAAVKSMIAAGNALQDLPYGPQGHPDPVGASAEDCSSTVNYVLWAGGVRSLNEIVDENPLAQSYVDWGRPGPGRWVTIYATVLPTPHVFMTIAGLRLDTSYNGTDIGPNRDQSGPRWRIFPTIPTWAHWAVRHPPGL
ncbi:MAG TPA: lytic transglycosylase domain-containing protein [Solirubrobacteraceae bacterium]|nr:lytic transglycosylase domain-containing protein [Solirubrobacteraceae bacterium]